MTHEYYVIAYVPCPKCGDMHPILQDKCPDCNQQGKIRVEVPLVEAMVEVYDEAYRQRWHKYHQSDPHSVAGPRPPVMGDMDGNITSRGNIGIGLDGFGVAGTESSIMPKGEGDE